jgi:uncharacterized repeat protein (TIGR02543 family)
VSPNSNNISKTGYTLTGWNTARDGSGRNYQAAQQATWQEKAGNVTLYAQWAPVRSAITYDLNGGSGNAPTNPNTATFGSIFVSPSGSPSWSKTGYNFTGWNTARDGSGRSYQAGQQATWQETATNVTLYAVWTPIQVLIKYHGNNATSGNAPADQQISYGTTYTMAGQGTLQRTGYTFVCWNTQANGSGQDYLPNQQYTMNNSTPGTMDLYAKWKVTTGEVRVHFIDELGNDLHAPIKITHKVGDRISMKNANNDSNVDISQTVNRIVNQYYRVPVFKDGANLSANTLDENLVEVLPNYRDVYYIFQGALTIKEVPTFDFGTVEVSAAKVKAPIDTIKDNLIISDTQINTRGWNLTVSLSKKFTNNRGKELSPTLVLTNSSNQEVDIQYGNSKVLESTRWSTTTPPQNEWNLSNLWKNNKNTFRMEFDGRTLPEYGDYQGELEWHLNIVP